MRFVTAREANQGFSHILKQAEDGESVVITRRGRPVAMLTLCPVSNASEREQAVQHIAGLMRKGIPIGRRFTRDEMHEEP